MIRNVVFDLGNVLISFQPSEFLDNLRYQDPLKQTILTDIFGSRHWLALDNGDLTTAEAIEGVISESSLEKDLVLEIFKRRGEILIPITSNLKLLPELKKKGLRLFYLSNFPLDLWKDVRNGSKLYNYDFFKHFDGGLISAEARCSKPNPRIYSMLLDHYSLNPSECLYIDDLEVNVEGAEAAGMKGIVTFGSDEIFDRVINAL